MSFVGGINLSENNQDSDKPVEEKQPFLEKKVEQKTEKPEEKDSNISSFLIGKHLVLSVVIVLVVGAFFGFYGHDQLNPTGQIILPDGNDNPDKKPVSSDALSVELFVMSQCPYGTQAEDAVIPVVEAFGDKVVFQIHFIASESGSDFTSLHGQPEVDEDIRQVCIQEKVSQKKFFDYLTCVNQDIKNVESNWKSCAENSGINVSEIESCFDSDTGKNLLRENIKKSNDLQIGSSPSYYINNKPYTGGRSPQDLTRTLCSYIDAEVCDTLPPETEVNLFVVNDSDCKACDAETIVSQLKGFFPKLNVTELDYASEEGKKALEKFQSETVPLFYFDSTISEHYNWEQFQLYTSEVEGEYALNYTGNKFFNKTEKENHIDLFVMSQCPYGTKAEKNLKEVVEALPDLTYNIYFLASETEGGFDSLHGQVEVNEDIRQICVMKYYRDKLLGYQECVNKDIINVEGNWKACAIENEIEVSVIESCFDSDEGKNLFRENIAEAKTFFGAVSGSPTYVINGQTVYNSRTAGFPVSAETMKQLVCSYNDLEGCNKTLSGADNTNNTPSGSC